MKKTNHTIERVFTLEKETEQSLKEPYRDATLVSVKENGKTFLRMWVKNGERTACFFKYDGRLWMIYFEGESRKYEKIGSYALKMIFSENSPILKRQLNRIADEAWNEYKDLIA